ncbi:MAG: hypothetical protein EAZ55_00425 [Cytophagales bacterium]|nr:MAG: hypothetical protein EAZ55_00425 [Cytophagales bacterium]
MTDTTNPDKKRTLLVGTIVALVLLNLILTYFVITNQQIISEQSEKLAKQEKAYETVKNSTTKQLDSLSREIDEQIKEAQELGVDYETLVETKKQLEKDLKEIKENNSKEISYYQRKLAAYEELLIKKDEELTKLRSDVETLYGNNVELQNQKNQLYNQMSELSSQNEDMQKKVSTAGTLKINSLQIAAVSSNGKELYGGQYKGSQIIRLKVYYAFGSNPLAKIGQRAIFMRIIEPGGTVLSVGTFKANGQSLNYTAMQQVLFDNSQRTEVFTYTKSGEFKAGQHFVEIYADGTLVGSGGFSVR